MFDKLRKDFGFLESAKKQMPVNGDGEVMPMYTYPYYEYLNSIDWTGTDVFEYGTGFSTVLRKIKVQIFMVWNTTNSGMIKLMVRN